MYRKLQIHVVQFDDGCIGDDRYELAHEECDLRDVMLRCAQKELMPPIGRGCGEWSVGSKASLHVETPHN
jgi:hypothetical protein